MSHLQLGRISSAMVGMSAVGIGVGTATTTTVAATYPLLLSSSSMLGVGLRATTSAGCARPCFASFGRNTLIGGLALTGHRGFASLPEGAQEVGKLVSSATEKMGLGDNQFAAGGFQLALIGGILAGIRVLGSYAIEYFKKKIIVTAEFDSRDESYSWILNWLSDHPYSKKATHFSVSTTIARGAQKINGEGGDSAIAATYFLPAPGLHFFWYRNRLLWLHRERARPAGSTVATSGSAVENITISTIGRSRDLIQSLILEAQRKFIDRDQSRTVIFQADQYDTIVMDPKLKNYIVEDAKEFFASESWYAERGLPFRRGLLLYGSPGTGKTSFIHALAGELGLNIYVVNLSSKNLTDDTLSELVSDTPSRCLLLIEDVDAAFVQRESQDAAKGITFSGLLNSVDGVSAQEGRILCMTTNHLERLDEALIRPGRVDVRAKFGKASQLQAKELFIKFYPHVSGTRVDSSVSKEPNNNKRLSAPSNLSETTNYLDNGNSTVSSMTSPAENAINSLSAAQTEALATQFAKVIPDQMFSIAQLQGFLMGYKKSPELAVKHAEKFVRQAGSAEVSGTAKVEYDEETTGKASEKQFYWEDDEEKQGFREEKERERKASLK
ncbi:mitochondrial chaperone [Lobosporangium transversale]|nr:mitochondrial chaperone [Lobosporangium transversale]